MPKSRQRKNRRRYTPPRVMPYIAAHPDDPELMRVMFPPEANTVVLRMAYLKEWRDAVQRDPRLDDTARRVALYLADDTERQMLAPLVELARQFPIGGTR